MYKVKSLHLIGTWKTKTSFKCFYKVNIIGAFLTLFLQKKAICIYIDSLIYAFALTKNNFQRAKTGLYQNK